MNITNLSSLLTTAVLCEGLNSTYTAEFLYSGCRYSGNPDTSAAGQDVVKLAYSNVSKENL